MLLVSSWFLAWVLILSVYGSEDAAPPCPRNAIVKEGSDVFECPCGLKTCLVLCCPFGKSRTEGKCVEDNETFSHLPGTTPQVDENTEPEGIYHIVIDDPCAVGWMDSTVLESFQVFLNGSIHSPDFGDASVLDFEHYCLFREPGSSVYLAKVCRPKTHAIYDIFCLSVATITMLAVFVGYTVVPELNNFHGLIFRSYIATYIGIYLCSLGAELTIESRTYAQLFSIFSNDHKFMLRYRINHRVPMAWLKPILCFSVLW